MLQRLRESLTLILIALLPFHALFVTLGTRVLLGPGHAPMQALALWKEMLLGLILFLALVEVLHPLFDRARARVPSPFSIDLFDGLIVALLGIAVVLFLYRPWMTTTGFVLGFKYDFIPLIAFLILRRVPWSIRFRTHVEDVLLAVAGIVALYGLLTILAPKGYFRLLGYSDAHSLYLPNGPLAAFQQISGSGIRRIQSTFSGPNQMGIWLLIPFSILATRVFHLKRLRSRSSKMMVALGILLLVALMLTFSRSAWIGTFVIVSFAGSRALPKKVFRDAFIGIVSLAAIAGVAASLIAPQIFLRATSTREHIARPLRAIHEMVRYPLGFGLGAAGPAANRTHEPCVYLERGADASWAKNSPQLCVFVGPTQVQPTEHRCDCALLPENWYLQLGVELGLPGMLLSLALTALVLWRLRKSEVAFLLFLSISIAALFLHAWEDAAAAYTAWLMVAAVLSL
ncbi:hypothetical protein EXS70_02735 [Candidatus Peribacteria bacterium]|nr:hypothetical protein [Candidatus Peribacteria bacterium]